MKKWWQKTPGEFWIDLFVREKTRWIAVVLFLCATVLANWVVLDAALEGSTFGRYGSTVSIRSEPLLFSFWITWRTIAAFVLDVILLWAVIAVWKERGRTKPPENNARDLT